MYRWPTDIIGKTLGMAIAMAGSSYRPHHARAKPPKLTQEQIAQQKRTEEQRIRDAADKRARKAARAAKGMRST